MWRLLWFAGCHKDDFIFVPCLSLCARLPFYTAKSGKINSFSVFLFLSNCNTNAKTNNKSYCVLAFVFWRLIMYSYNTIAQNYAYVAVHTQYRMVILLYWKCHSLKKTSIFNKVFVSLYMLILMMFCCTW